jgi:hypothetical protein
VKTKIVKIIFSGLITCTMVFAMVGNVFADFPPVQECTGGYFCDTETSIDNIVTAGTLDFSLTSTGDFSPTLTPSQTTSSRTIIVSQDGTLDFQYRARVENANGGLCSYLEFSDDLPGSSPSPLIGYSSASTTISAKTNWTMISSSSSSVPSLQGTICNFKLVFEGWQDNVINYGDEGFSNTEEIDNTIQMGYWDPPVVLNEFLPNAGDYPEFIEIYNKTGGAIDLAGFYIQTDNSIIPIDATTTATYSNASTTIPANGWLVVATGGDFINNTFGTISLHDTNDIVVDTYTYGTPENNINNTIGWTNNLIAYWPFDGDLLDKSGNGNNGINYGATSTVGKINQAMSFDGINDYIEVASSSSINISGDKITLEAWVNLNSLPAVGSRWVVFAKTDAYALQVADEGKVRVYLGSSSVFVQTDSVEIVAGSWYHLVATYDGSSVKIYVNGLLKKQVARIGNQSTSLNNLIIGAKVPSGYFNGLIDEVKIYDRALDITEVTNHYNATGDGGVVPVDKSYARIPDGTGDWVDPIPTPGMPNILIEEVVIEVPEVVLVPDIVATEEASEIAVTTPTTTPDVFTTEEVVTEDDFVTDEILIGDEEIVNETILQEEIITTEGTQGETQDGIISGQPAILTEETAVVTDTANNSDEENSTNE